MAILDDSEGDIDRMRESLARWYSEMMERVTGRFKRRALIYLFVVAFTICAGFNIDSISDFQFDHAEVRSRLRDRGPGTERGRGQAFQFGLRLTSARSRD